jgi:hypothetical protein
MGHPKRTGSARTALRAWSAFAMLVAAAGCSKSEDGTRTLVVSPARIRFATDVPVGSWDIVAKVRKANGVETEVPSALVNWVSSDESVAIVADGAAEQVGEGVATLTATYDGLTATARVTVAPAIQVAASDLPSAGAVQDSAAYYVVSGLTEGSRYTVTADQLTSDLDLYSSFPGHCLSVSRGTLAEACSFMAGANGALWVVLLADKAPSGGTFTLSVAPETPRTTVYIDAVDLPSSQTLDATIGQYVITGLEWASWYTVSAGSVGADVDLEVNPDGWSMGCRSGVAGRAVEACVARSNGGEILLRVDARYQPGATTFTIDAGPYQAPIDAVLTFPLAGPKNGSIAGRPTRFEVTGLTPGEYYWVTLGDEGSPLTLTVFDTPSLMDDATCASSPATGGPRLCIAIANGSGKLFVELAGAAGTPFSLYVHPYVPPAVDATLTYGTAALPLAGTLVTEVRFYGVTGLAPGAPYDVTLTSISSSADLFVFPDSSFLPASVSCSSTNAGAADEYCRVVANHSGEIFAIISGAPGTTFTLGVAPPPALPLDGTLALGVARTGTVSEGTLLHYGVSGLTGGALYSIDLTGLADDVDLHIFTDPAFLDRVCVSDRLGAASEACTWNANADGTLYVLLDGSWMSTGGTSGFRVIVTAL